MTPFAKQFVPTADILMLNKIKMAVEKLPDIDLGVDHYKIPVLLSCHILCRALAKIFDLKYVDGYFHPTSEHSWLLTKNGNIIDAYPIAVLGGPILMEGKNKTARSLYKKANCRKLYPIHFFSMTWFKRSVRRIVKALKTNME